MNSPIEIHCTSGQQSEAHELLLTKSELHACKKAHWTRQERQKPREESTALMVFQGLLNMLHLVKTVANNKYSQGPARSGCYCNMSHITANIQTGMNVKEEAGGLFQSP